jgi:hypothetical protein
VTDLYIHTLIRNHPGIKQVWRFGSRANGSAETSSDWDYLVFADRPTFDAIASDQSSHNASIDLFIVYDGDSFEKPWPDGDRTKRGSLSGWKWTPTPDGEATYCAKKERDGEEFRLDVWTAKAHRIYPLRLGLEER